MTFYIKLKSENPEIYQYDIGKLGESTKTFFYADRGFNKFKKIINEFPELIDELEIYDSDNKKYTADTFLKKISNLKFNEN